MKTRLHKYARKLYNYAYIIVGGIIMAVKVGIVGVTGYAGGELIRLLLNHPEAEIVAASSRSNVGNPVSAVHKQFYGYMDLVECEIKAENYTECDVVFLALPHGASSGLAKELVAMGKKVIDLGAYMRCATMILIWNGMVQSINGRIFFQIRYMVCRNYTEKKLRDRI